MTPAPVITADMLGGVTSAITQNLGVAVPVALGIFAIILGIKFVPKIIKMIAK